MMIMRSQKSLTSVPLQPDGFGRTGTTGLFRLRNLLRDTCSRILIVFLSLFLLNACVGYKSQYDGIGKPVAWSRLPGWGLDRVDEVWPVLLRSCQKLQQRSLPWQGICREARLVSGPDIESVRAFIETRFVAHEMYAEANGTDGLITGYYEPLLFGSRTKSERYRFPLYRAPSDLLTVDLGSIYPELANKVVRARIKNKRVVPYYSRAEIDNGGNPLKGNELVWVDNIVDLFFLHIQGSGRIQLDDGRELAVGYADQNGHPYESIGTQLIRMGELEAKAVNMPSIKDWLSAYPDKAIELLNSNPSYIFFSLRLTDDTGPVGSLNVPLTSERSIAVDRRYIPLGFPVWLDTKLPNQQPYQRLMMAQDTGGAIKGSVRADVFFGHGQRAERLAGNMKQPGRLYILLPAGISGIEGYAMRGAAD